MARAIGSWGAIAAKTIALTPAMAHPKAAAPKIIVATEPDNLPTWRTTDRNPCGAFFASIPRSTISTSKEARESLFCSKVAAAQANKHPIAAPADLLCEAIAQSAFPNSGSRRRDHNRRSGTSSDDDFRLFHLREV
jgi:hypothetical protein